MYLTITLNKMCIGDQEILFFTVFRWLKPHKLNCMGGNYVESCRVSYTVDLRYNPATQTFLFSTESNNNVTCVSSILSRL